MNTALCPTRAVLSCGEKVVHSWRFPVVRLRLLICTLMPSGCARKNHPARLYCKKLIHVRIHISHSLLHGSMSVQRCKTVNSMLDAPHPRRYLPRVKLFGVFVLLPILALAQSAGQATPVELVCPLSESQTQKSVEAFSKIASFLTTEKRCFNCHGGVNPYIDGTGPDPEDPNAPLSQTEHAEGKMDRENAKSADGTPLMDQGCDGCHSHMAPKRGGKWGDSIWTIAPGFLSFVGKDAPTLCKQIRGASRDAEDFIGHLTDDNGGNTFGATAFNGDRGLDPDMYPQFDYRKLPASEKPRISHEELLKLGHEWVNSTGGEFKGDKSCGCEPALYAIRVTSFTEYNNGPVHFKSALPPMDISITFEDDGTFRGEAMANFGGAGAVAAKQMVCTGGYTDSMKVRASGQATETSEKHSMNLKLENSSPDVSSVSGQCPGVGKNGTFNKKNIDSEKTILPFDLAGKVGEFLDYTSPQTMAGFDSTMHLEIIKLAEPQK
jgi:hypothetical protein